MEKDGFSKRLAKTQAQPMDTDEQCSSPTSTKSEKFAEFLSSDEEIQYEEYDESDSPESGAQAVDEESYSAQLARIKESQKELEQMIKRIPKQLCVCQNTKDVLQLKSSTTKIQKMQKALAASIKKLKETQTPHPAPAAPDASHSAWVQETLKTLLKRTSNIEKYLEKGMVTQLSSEPETYTVFKWPLKTIKDVEELAQLIEEDDEIRLRLMSYFRSLRSDSNKERQTRLDAIFDPDLLLQYNKTGRDGKRSTRQCPIFKLLKASWVHHTFSEIDFEKLILERLSSVFRRQFMRQKRKRISQQF